MLARGIVVTRRRRSARDRDNAGQPAIDGKAHSTWGNLKLSRRTWTMTPARRRSDSSDELDLASVRTSQVHTLTSAEIKVMFSLQKKGRLFNGNSLSRGGIKLPLR